MKRKLSGTNAKQPLLVTTLLLLSLWGIIFSIGCTAGENRGNLTPPPGFQPLAEVDLSSRPFDGEILGQFTLEDTAVTTIIYTLPNTNISIFDLSLRGPDNANQVILHSEDYRTDVNGGGTWEKTLPPGDYRLALTANRSPGVLTVYWKAAEKP